MRLTDDAAEAANEAMVGTLPDEWLGVVRGVAEKGRGDADTAADTGGKKPDELADAMGVRSPRPPSRATRAAHCRSKASHSGLEATERVMSSASACRAQKSL